MSTAGAADKQTTSRSDTVTMDYDWQHPIFIQTTGIRTTNIRIDKAPTGQYGDKIHVEALVSSMSTTLHGRLHLTSKLSAQNEYSLRLDVDRSLWDLGLTSAEIQIWLPPPPPSEDESCHEERVHPGIRLDLKTLHGPAHLSDVVADEIRLEAHHGNITVHDCNAKKSLRLVGDAAWMDIDDVIADVLEARSTDAILSLKDIQASTLGVSTTNARIGLGNIKAGTLTAETTGGEVHSEHVQANACNVRTTNGCIEGRWIPRQKLYLSTTEAPISAQVSFPSDVANIEMVFNSTKAPIRTDNYYKAFVTTRPSNVVQPTLHVSEPDKKAGLFGDGSKRHSLKAETTDAPINISFSGL
ncbi:hypothetical protein DL89DRAFT_295689 [Linderina pennispora]|uniref:DUF4097 domain-containing protein n=1 Tax=Linderina pennispora TaxID=61395 RepID=A0A1Y1VYU6_9FUNG|nr:uncharacterized protein DL89DRAFT_295689 [Linderina pennispora]ORX66195.1 hypothetical protein DL89DRAFT_295689 [Linderina pennispora]